jgi:hypothetical protein
MNNVSNEKEKTIGSRIKKEKELLISQLAKTPIVSVACEKTGLARATYYRWRKADTRFAKEADGAIAQGNLLINDMAESQLLSSIKDKNMTAIIFWLKHHHPAYETRIELRQVFGKSEQKLNKRQQEIIRQALKITSIGKKLKLKGDDNDKKENK